MKKIIILLTLFIFLSLIGSGQDLPVKQETKKTVLNGHTFPTLITIPSPFVNTSFRANIGLGQTAKVTIPGIQIGDYEITTFEGKVAFVNLNVRYQQKFNNWLALKVSYKLAARLGLDMSTILVDGVNTMNGFEIGWKIRVFESRKIYLSSDLMLRNIRASYINVRDYFEELINNNPDPSVTKVIPALGAVGGLNFAYGISPTFGLQLFGNYIYGESMERGETSGQFSAGITIDADLEPTKSIPLGFTLGYAITTTPEMMINNESNTNIAIAGINYTGSDDFELGLYYEGSQFDSPRFMGTAVITTATILFKYYF